MKGSGRKIQGMEFKVAGSGSEVDGLGRGFRCPALGQAPGYWRV